MGHVVRLVVGLDEVRRLRHVRGLRDVGRLRRAAKTERENFVQDRAKKWSPGCESYSSKLRQKQ